MTTTTQQIIDNLNQVFKKFDDEVLESSKKWAQERVAAIHEFKMSDEAKHLRRDQWAYYAKLFALAGGKSWYNVFDGRPKSMIEEFMEKNHQNTIDKRNASIAKKFEKAGVTEVLSEEYVYTKDGFNGIFRVNTDAGVKRVSIDTIYAGGYNIQCLHLRVLVKVK